MHKPGAKTLPHCATLLNTGPATNTYQSEPTQPTKCVQAKTTLTYHQGLHHIPCMDIHDHEGCQSGAVQLAQVASYL